MFRTALSICAVAALAIAAACGGGGDDDVSPIPTLAGTAIPSVTVQPTATAVCDAPSAGPLPTSFPADVPVPPDAVPEQIVTDPHLTVVFRVAPPDVDRTKPYAVVGEAMIDQLQARGWRVILNEQADGVDRDFTQDTRRGHFNSIPYIGCDEQGYVRLTMDLFWITP